MNIQQWERFERHVIDLRTGKKGIVYLADRRDLSRYVFFAKGEKDSVPIERYQFLDIPRNEY